jgi:hypothetical protein
VLTGAESRSSVHPICDPYRILAVGIVRFSEKELKRSVPQRRRDPHGTSFDAVLSRTLCKHSLKYAHCSILVHRQPRTQTQQGKRKVWLLVATMPSTHYLLPI